MRTRRRRRSTRSLKSPTVLISIDSDYNYTKSAKWVRQSFEHPTLMIKTEKFHYCRSKFYLQPLYNAGKENVCKNCFGRKFSNVKHTMFDRYLAGILNVYYFIMSSLPGRFRRAKHKNEEKRTRIPHVAMFWQNLFWIETYFFLIKPLNYWYCGCRVFGHYATV